MELSLAVFEEDSLLTKVREFGSLSTSCFLEGSIPTRRYDNPDWLCKIGKIICGSVKINMKDKHCNFDSMKKRLIALLDFAI